MLIPKLKYNMKSLILFLLSLCIILVSCDPEASEIDDENVNNNQEENEIAKKLLSDLSLIGFWRNIEFGKDNFLSSIRIDSLGSISSYRMNHTNGKFELLQNDKYIIEVKNDTIEHLNYNRCDGLATATYVMIGDTLSINLESASTTKLNRYVRTELEAYKGQTRPISSVTADIEIETTNYQAPNEGDSIPIITLITKTFDFNASNDYELITGYYSDFSTNFVLRADNDFTCSSELNKELILVLDTEVIGVGTYNIIWASIQVADFKDSLLTNYVKRAPENNLIDGQVTVEFFEKIEDLKHIRGTFNIFFEDEYFERLYKSSVKNGVFNLYLKSSY